MHKLYDYSEGRVGNLIAERKFMRGAARQAARIVSEEETVGGRHITQVLMTGPGMKDRLYDARWKDRTYKYRERCPGLDGQPCANEDDPWMHPTTPTKDSQHCIHCWSPTAEMRATLSERNRVTNPIRKPRLRRPIAA